MVSVTWDFSKGICPVCWPRIHSSLFVSHLNLYRSVTAMSSKEFKTQLADAGMSLCELDSVGSEVAVWRLRSAMPSWLMLHVSLKCFSSLFSNWSSSKAYLHFREENWDLLGFECLFESDTPSRMLLDGRSCDQYILFIGTEQSILEIVQGLFYSKWSITVALHKLKKISFAKLTESQ